MILLLLVAGVADPDILMSTARARLAAGCDAGQCGPARSSYRVPSDDPAAITAKDRAIREDGSKCNVVGARRCPKRGRTVFRAAFGP